MRLWRLLLLVILLGCVFEEAQCQKSFVVLTFADAAVTALDGYQTSQIGSHEDSSAWLYGTYPYRHRARFSATLAAEVGGVAAIGYYMRHSEHPLLRKFWWVPQTASISGHSWGVVYNFRHDNGGF